MKRYLVISIVLGTVVTSTLAADTYTIDPAYSPANFDIARVGFSSQRGTFKKTHGKVILDFAAKTGSVDFTIQSASIDMGSAAWTSHLSDPGLFNVKKFPTMNFKSEKLVFDGEKVVAADGLFTMLGVTKPLRVTVKDFQCGNSSVDKRSLCSGNITAKLKRSDFGLTKYIPVVSDEVSISVPVDAYKN
ncbi:YceI family protein [Rhodoferax ferrireducens]|uniref:YceI family protein n=1 Tax=Rhodoferax ferrireducens TaxID=192843 RepID=UPI00298EBD09|nr:YceI family protein [Rhodoferax ferrireducens]WPC67886.1 YceI family protein [Rhodoferax ferrireducens]